MDVKSVRGPIADLLQPMDRLVVELALRG